MVLSIPGSREPFLSLSTLLPLTNLQFLILVPLILLFHRESFFKFWKAKLGFSDGVTDGPTNDGEIPLTNTTSTSLKMALFCSSNVTILTDHENSLVTIELINPCLSMPSRRMSLLLCHLLAEVVNECLKAKSKGYVKTYDCLPPQVNV